MRPKSIGIVGGAGPLAGAYLLERLISCANTEYGCTELSLLSPYFNSSDRVFINPIEIISKQVLEKSFLDVKLKVLK